MTAQPGEPSRISTLPITAASLPNPVLIGFPLTTHAPSRPWVGLGLPSGVCNLCVQRRVHL